MILGHMSGKTKLIAAPTTITRKITAQNRTEKSKSIDIQLVAVIVSLDHDEERGVFSGIRVPTDVIVLLRDGETDRRKIRP
jgi:hypothetical protein